jgi:prepilin-type processing-associated H-X9-DG protein
MRQLGVALGMYAGDYDETLFFFGHNVDHSRANPAAPLGASAANRWWNQILPYTSNVPGLLICPDDPRRTPNSTDNKPRSYVANRAAEALSLAQVDIPADIVVVTEKGAPFDDSWYEPPKNLYDKPGFTEPVLAIRRHSEGVNNMFFDGHAKWLSKGELRRDPCGSPYSGVQLMRQYPIPLPNPARVPWHALCPG